MQNYREQLIANGAINPKPAPKSDRRPCLRLDEWALHEAARDVAEALDPRRVLDVAAACDRRVGVLVPRYVP